MNKLTLIRSYLENRTPGIMVADGLCLATLERPWCDNQSNISCIPEGSYICSRDKSGKFQYYKVNDVEGRSSIEMHAGNSPSDSQGCILVGLDHTQTYGLSRSKDGLAELLQYIGDNDFLLVIRAAKAGDW